MDLRALKLGKHAIASARSRLHVESMPDARSSLWHPCLNFRRTGGGRKRFSPSRSERNCVASRPRTLFPSPFLARDERRVGGEHLAALLDQFAVGDRRSALLRAVLQPRCTAGYFPAPS
jgi:hypothetical protein